MGLTGTITSPANNTVLNPGLVNIEATCSDGKVDIYFSAYTSSTTLLAPDKQTTDDDGDALDSFTIPASTYPDNEQIRIYIATTADDPPTAGNILDTCLCKLVN